MLTSSHRGPALRRTSPAPQIFHLREDLPAKQQLTHGGSEVNSDTVQRTTYVCRHRSRDFCINGLEAFESIVSAYNVTA
jgi:hypothetical protein